jgi:hypothetical protein
MIDLGTRLELSVDDHLIDHLRGASRLQQMPTCFR